MIETIQKGQSNLHYADCSEDDKDFILIQNQIIKLIT